MANDYITEGIISWWKKKKCETAYKNFVTGISPGFARKNSLNYIWCTKLSHHFCIAANLAVAKNCNLYLWVWPKWGPENHPIIHVDNTGREANCIVMSNTFLRWIYCLFSPMIQYKSKSKKRSAANACKAKVRKVLMRNTRQHQLKRTRTRMWRWRLGQVLWRTTLSSCDFDDMEFKANLIISCPYMYIPSIYSKYYIRQRNWVWWIFIISVSFQVSKIGLVVLFSLSKGPLLPEG